MKKFNPKVSIIIPVYNGSNFLKEAIDSALIQTYKNIEIIVVNDGSTDDGATDKIAKSYGDKIRYYKKKNGGVASALNFGIKKMTGQYVSWLSHDDVYYPEKVEKQVASLSKNDDDAIVFSNVEYIDHNSKTLYKTSYESKYTQNQLANGMFIVVNGFANGCALLVPKSCFDKYGLFDESLRTSNDYDMWFRLFRKSKIIFIPDVLIKYRIHELQGTKTDQAYDGESNELWSKIINELTEKEILEFNDSLFSFYFDMARRMSAAKLDKAHAIAVRLAEKFYKKSSRLVSVIMPCYNSEVYLREAVDSIITQTFGNFELLVVNDKSTDNTVKIIKEYIKKDYRIKLLDNIYNKGIAGAMNTGIKYAEGKYITRMDSDDISISDRLEKQVNFLENNVEYGLCSVNISLFGEQNVETLFSKKEAPLEWLFLWENPIANAPVMYRGAIIKEHKLKFGKYKLAEDYDFLTRVLPFVKPYTLNEVLYSYRVRSDSVFHNDVDAAIKNSIIISNELVFKITGQKAPDFHKYLTVFSNKSPDENVNIIIMALWLKELLQKFSLKWKWTEGEYDSALKDADKRLISLVTMMFPRINIASDGAVIPRSISTTTTILRVKNTVPYRAVRKLYREGPKGLVKAVVARVSRK